MLGGRCNALGIGWGPQCRLACGVVLLNLRDDVRALRAGLDGDSSGRLKPIQLGDYPSPLFPLLRLLLNAC